MRFFCMVYGFCFCVADARVDFEFGSSSHRRDIAVEFCLGQHGEGVAWWVWFCLGSKPGMSYVVSCRGKIWNIGFIGEKGAAGSACAAFLLWSFPELPFTQPMRLSEHCTEYRACPAFYPTPHIFPFDMALRGGGLLRIMLGCLPPMALWTFVACEHC